MNSEELALYWKRKKKKKTGNELLQNQNTIFVNDLNSNKRKKGFTLWD